MSKKKKDESLNENINIKLTKDQKDVFIENAWIAAEIRKQVREYLDIYVDAIKNQKTK